MTKLGNRKVSISEQVANFLYQLSPKYTVLIWLLGLIVFSTLTAFSMVEAQTVRALDGLIVDLSIDIFLKMGRFITIIALGLMVFTLTPSWSNFSVLMCVVSCWLLSSLMMFMSVFVLGSVLSAATFVLLLGVMLLVIYGCTFFSEVLNHVRSLSGEFRFRC